MRTQVGIVGAGPAGLILGELLRQAGIDSVILEVRSRAYVEGRIRAGVLEHDVADLLRQLGVGARLDALGLPHTGTQFLFGGALHRIDFQDLTGKHVTVYGQHEVVRDLIAGASGGRCADRVRGGGRRDRRVPDRGAARHLPGWRGGPRVGLRLHRGLRRISWHLPAGDSGG